MTSSGFVSTIPTSGTPMVDLLSGAVNPAWYRFLAQFYRDAQNNSLTKFNALSVLGNAQNGSTYPKYLSATANGQFLQRDSDGLSFRYPKLPVFTVAGLPSASQQGAGTMVFCSNARNGGEGVGAGTGSIVASDGTNWKIPGIAGAVTA